MVILVAPAKIIFNGQSYESIDQMPAEVREEFLRLVAPLGDANRNGIPDFAERQGNNMVSVDERIVFNGREYHSLDELPPDVRQLLAKMPPLKPGEPRTQVQVETKVLPPEGSFTAFHGDSLWGRGDRTRSNSSRFLVGLLVAIILALLVLWLAGIRPEELFR